MKAARVDSGETVDTLVLGAGLCGLAAAAELGDRATVLERESRPGGLVRSLRLGDHWFDHVIHLLHLRDDETLAFLKALLGDVLTPCPPEAWIETTAGTARFPLQTHIGTLAPDVVARVLDDLAEIDREPVNSSFANYLSLLRGTFGETLCALFFEPYNQKMWRRPLAELAASGSIWNIHKPSYQEALEGALHPERKQESYNSAAWYPRPPRDSGLRGMEVLSQALATCAHDLRLDHTVTSLNTHRRTVTVQGDRTFAFVSNCLSTLPLRLAIELAVDAPAALKRTVRNLRANKVLSVAIAVQGSRPDMGHWRYYPDPELIFTRLVFLHEFDPAMAPDDGWPLLAEVPWPAELPVDPATVAARVIADARLCGVLGPGQTVLESKVVIADPAYVVFDAEGLDASESAREWLIAQGITPLGRYGRWEYSSMAQVLADGRRWARSRRSA